MSVSTVDLAKARDSAKAILEALQLDAYVYGVEPREEVWELTVECACEIDGAWETIILQLPWRLLLECIDSDEAKQDLIAYCKKQLAGCKLRET